MKKIGLIISLVFISLASQAQVFKDYECKDDFLASKGTDAPTRQTRIACWSGSQSVTIELGEGYVSNSSPLRSCLSAPLEYVSEVYVAQLLFRNHDSQSEVAPFGLKKDSRSMEGYKIRQSEFAMVGAKTHWSIQAASYDKTEKVDLELDRYGKGTISINGAKPIQLEGCN